MYGLVPVPVSPLLCPLVVAGMRWLVMGPVSFPPSGDIIARATATHLYNLRRQAIPCPALPNSVMLKLSLTWTWADEVNTHLMH